MNKLIFFITTISFLLSFTDYAFADDQTSESEIAIPDLIINFDDAKHWYGLESGETPYWKIEDGVGKFYIDSENLEPGDRQLESASIDFQKLLGDEIGEDWVLRYKQGTDSSWSQLLIGLFSKPTSGNNPDITHGDANQWGIGTGFMTGVDMTRIMLMYDLGFYLQWHSEPDKGKFGSKR